MIRFLANRLIAALPVLLIVGIKKLG